MRHVVLDLETLGTKPGCVILQIGACTLDSDEVFESTIDIDSCKLSGLHTDKETEAWWREQNRETQAKVMAGQTVLISALFGFKSWLAGLGDSKEICIWGNGSDFDNVILASAYAVYGMEAPWEFRNNRCLRTLRSLFPNTIRVQPVIPHLALEDAKAERDTLRKLFGRLAYLNTQTGLTSEN